MENRKNDNKGEFLDLYKFTVLMTFEIFNEKSHYPNGHFQKNRKNHI